MQVKICGLTNIVDAQAAVNAGADFVGFVFAAESKRRVTPAVVGEIVRRLPRAVRKVGVFVNEPAAHVVAVLRECGLDIAQLHGEELPAVSAEIGPDRVWKVVHLRTPQDVAAALELPAALLVADTAAGGARGGTGQTGDWALAAQLAARRPLVLAGGLTPENVAAAVAAVRPAAVDVSSGIERAPGIKDHDRLRRFIAAAHAVTP